MCAERLVNRKVRDAFRFSTARPVVAILIAPGFDKSVVADCVAKVSQAGCAPVLVSQTARRVVGRYGCATQAALTLEHVRAETAPRAILLDGEGVCLTALSADPRVATFLASALAHGAIIGVLNGRRQTCVDAGILPARTGSACHAVETGALSNFLEVVQRRQRPRVGDPEPG